jgi:hypothetical protein
MPMRSAVLRDWRASDCWSICAKAGENWIGWLSSLVLDRLMTIDRRGRALAADHRGADEDDERCGRSECAIEID